MSPYKAVEMLKEQKLIDKVLSWHTVSTFVNNVSHKDAKCREQIEVKYVYTSHYVILSSQYNNRTYMLEWIK